MTEAGGRTARLLEGAALACILAVLVARPFVAEMPFRTSQLVLAAAEEGEVPHKSSDELLRVTFAMVLLAAFVFWSIGQVFRRKFRPIGIVFAILLLVFSAWTFAGALRAVDVRSALTGWFEQTTILLSGLVMMHLAGDRRRLALVIVVLAALAGVMGFKAIAASAWEIPQRIAAFRAEPEKQLAQVGIRPGTPQAKMFEHRINDPASVGYFGLSNVFASLLIIVAASAGGLVVGKFAAARRSRRSAKLARGEIHLPTLAAVIGAGLFVLSLVALFLTRSKGGIAAASAAFVAAGIIMYRPGFFARHRRKFLAACAAVILAGICAVAGWGKIRGGLPGWSMQVRWEYWVGSVGIIEEKPLFGVGPGGFGDAYLRHRLPAAAESTKSAHNLIMDAATQYGLVGGAVYLAMLVWIFLVIVRNNRRQEVFSGGPEARPAAVQWCIFLSLVVLVIRAVWFGSMNPVVLVLEALIPAIAFGVCLLAAMWVGPVLGWGDTAGRYARIALAAGLAGFILHNFLTYTLWMPATATVFWVAAGAMAGPAFGLRTSAGRMRIPVAVLAIVALVMAGVWLARPVYRRTPHIRAAQTAYSGGRVHLAAEEMKLAVVADPLDAFAPADLARLYVREVQPAEAAEYAEKAWARSPNSSNAKILARTLRSIPNRRDKALEMAAKAVELDPMNMWFRREYAEMLLTADRFDETLRQIQEIRRIHRARPTISDLRLTDEELKKLDMMESGIKNLSG